MPLTFQPFRANRTIQIMDMPQLLASKKRIGVIFLEGEFTAADIDRWCFNFQQTGVLGNTDAQMSVNETFGGNFDTQPAIFDYLERQCELDNMHLDQYTFHVNLHALKDWIGHARCSTTMLASPSSSSASGVGGAV